MKSVFIQKPIEKTGDEFEHNHTSNVQPISASFFLHDILIFAGTMLTHTLYKYTLQ